MKRILCAILLLLVLVGCAQTSTTTEAQPAETVKGAVAELESPVEDIEPETRVGNFDKVINLLETKTLTGFDDESNKYYFKDNVMEIHLDNPIILQSVKPPFVVDTVVLENGAATGSCQRQFKENHLLEEMCRAHMDETMELDYEEYYIATPIKWLEEYNYKKIVDTKRDVVVAGRISATKHTFEDGTVIFVDYKGIPVRVEQGSLVLGFHDVKVA